MTGLRSREENYVWISDSDSVLVRTDGSRIHRVFSNLLDNAVKYSLAGTRIFVTMKTYDDKFRGKISW